MSFTAERLPSLPAASGPVRPLLAAGFGAASFLLGAAAGADPLLTLAATLAVVFVITVFADLTIGLAIFVAVTFADLLPVGASPLVSAVKLAGAVLALSWIALITTRRHERESEGLVAGQRPLVLALICFSAWSLISVLWSRDVGEALLATQRYALNFLLFAIVLSAVRTRRDLLWVLWAFVAGAVFSALFGLISPPDPHQDIARIDAAGLNANDLATVLVAGLVLSLGLASYFRRSPAVQLVASCAGLLCIAALMLTLSRSGMVSLAVALGATLLVASRSRGRTLALALLVATGAVAYFAWVAPPEALQRVATFESDQGTGRVDIWTVGWRMFESNPATGIGTGNFAETAPWILLALGPALSWLAASEPHGRGVAEHAVRRPRRRRGGRHRPLRGRAGTAA